jgi:DNA-binding NtrC family response regulator
MDLVRSIAKVDSTVLITGETGSGKERIARFLHDESSRAAGPFIAVNCGAITETLLEGELFGHARGAFTGATQDRQGLFEAAHTGTLLLDEVGEVKVVELHVPPLRERRDDMLPLARVLLTDTALRMKRPVLSIAPRAADQLLRYDWPGNVRELENAIERAVAIAHGTRVELDDLPDEVREAFPSHVATIAGTVRPLEEIEREYILAALELNGGNQTHTAEQLRIGSATLYRKLKSYGLIGTKSTPPRS